MREDSEKCLVREDSERGLVRARFSKRDVSEKLRHEKKNTEVAEFSHSYIALSREYHTQ